MTVACIVRCTNAAHKACVLAKLVVLTVRATGMKVWCRSTNTAVKAVSSLLKFATIRCQRGISEEVGVSSVAQKEDGVRSVLRD